MAIGDITKEDVSKAIRWIDENGEPPGWESSKYVLVVDGKEYSPKYALARAHFYVTRSELAPGAFKSARHSRAVLKGLGYEVREKGLPLPSKGEQPSVKHIVSQATRRPSGGCRAALALGQSSKGVIVDGNNVVYSKNDHSYVDVDQLVLVFSQLRSVYGFKEIRIVVKASLREIAGFRDYERLIVKLSKASKGMAWDILHEVPSGGDDDLTVIRFAIENDYMILSNDNFTNHIARHPEYAQSLAGRCLKFTVDNGNLHIEGIDARRK